MFETINEFLNIDNFILAFQRLKAYERDYYKDLYYDDLDNFGMNLNININTLIEKIKHETYEPGISYKIYLPKPNGLVRTITVLTFIDLIVYQAIVNILAIKFNDKFEYKHDNYVYGNIYNNDKKNNHLYFFKKWNSQWSKYINKSRKIFNEGNKCLCEFDIASFYDTIDHDILLKQIEDVVDDTLLLKTLKHQLKIWTSDNERTGFALSRGIPQGPKASSYLAEIVLHYIDEKMINQSNLTREVRYLRYVDDIRLFCNSTESAKRYLAYLDLLARDIGLIPQINKTGIIVVKDEFELNKYDNNLSKISTYYRMNGKLKLKDNRRLTERLIEEMTTDGELNRDRNKSLIRFSLYKIDKDNTIKLLLIQNLNVLHDLYDPVFYYLSRYFFDDGDVETMIIEILNTKVTYNYLVAIVFQYFNNVIDYSEKLFKDYYLDTVNKNWYIRYWMLDWIKNKSPNMLNIISDDYNHLIDTKLNYYKYLNNANDYNVKDYILNCMIKDRRVEKSLLGLRLKMESFFLTTIVDNQINDYVKGIIGLGVEESYICYNLKKESGISAEQFFDEKNFDLETLSFIDMVYNTAIQNRDINPSIWLSSINTICHIIIVNILKPKDQDFNIKEYSNLLTRNYIKENYPKASNNFSLINNRRNELAEIHPYDKDFKLAKTLRNWEVDKFKRLFIEGIKEIIDINNAVF